jgi:hypothetical protein
VGGLLIAGNIARGPAANHTLIIGQAVPAPVIIDEPQSQSAKAGDPVAFSVVATNQQPLSYQWIKNGAAIAGATGSAISFIADLASGGDYSVVISSPWDSVTSSTATLCILLPPLITGQPEDQNAAVGSSAVFDVSVSGTPPFYYQWFCNDSAIPGATLMNYSIDAVQATNAGTYYVQVTNDQGTVSSSKAALTVFYSAPGILQQPSNQRSGEGGSATFNVLAGGSPPLAYQWRFNQGALSGATHQGLTLSGITTNDAGSYSVLVSNPACSVTSAVATLTVVIAPRLGLQVSSGLPQLSLYGSPGGAYHVQYSTNLAGNDWTEFWTIPDLSTNPNLFSEPGLATNAARFYRARGE